jgi:hypothetical protein
MKHNHLCSDYQMEHRTMKRVRTKLVFLALLAISTAASAQDLTKLTPEELIRISSMEVFKGPIDRPSTDLGPVSGVSCFRTGYFASNASEEDAINKMKYSAVKLSADAIKNAICIERAQIDWKRNCNATIVCAGVAVKYKTQD